MRSSLIESGGPGGDHMNRPPFFSRLICCRPGRMLAVPSSGEVIGETAGVHRRRWRSGRVVVRGRARLVKDLAPPSGALRVSGDPLA